VKTRTTTAHFSDMREPLRLLRLALIVVGIVGLKLVSLRRSAV
jgi:hypothetical protein